ncbi:MAG: endonuclease/exonuclease/phosphatase family protein, partial [Anaerolineales bacterium]|nr:endonuclease/exonuclease/phosphatase family protein [Anaerolineales bacterium]
MNTFSGIENRLGSWVILYAILFLFFFQLIADFVEAIYAFGLLGTGIPPEIVCVLFFFSPLILLFFPKGLPGWSFLLVTELMVVSRLIEVFLDTRSRMLVAGLGVSCFMLLLPATFWYLGRKNNESSGLVLGSGLTIGLALSILFRTMGSGTDISTINWYQVIGWILAVVASVLLFRLNGKIDLNEGESQARQSAGFGKVLGLSLGLVAALTLLYFAFTAPNVIARWTGDNYLLIVSVLVLALGLVAALFTARQQLVSALSPGILLTWNVLFLLALVATILANQISFPVAPGGYPIYEAQIAPWALFTLRIALLSFPVVLIDFTLFARELIAVRPTPRATGASFTLGGLFLVVMIFAHVFTTTYDYIPLVGPFFRDKFWLVYLTVGIVMVLPLFLVRKQTFDFSQAETSGVFAGSLLLLGVSAIGAVLLTSAKPFPPQGESARMRVLTYNIQQGYSGVGLKNYDGQLELIREVEADIIGLQESDTNRIAGGNSDVVRYFADQLNMYSYYGPKTVTGTFGIALLSKYPIQNPETFYMYSKGEQTATIKAQVMAAGKKFNVFVTHLGNEGPIVQQEAILGEAAGKEDVVLVGDFN